MRQVKAFQLDSSSVQRVVVPPGSRLLKVTTSHDFRATAWFLLDDRTRAVIPDTWKFWLCLPDEKLPREATDETYVTTLNVTRMDQRGVERAIVHVFAHNEK